MKCTLLLFDFTYEANRARVCVHPQNTHHKQTQFECLIRSSFYIGKSQRDSNSKQYGSGKLSSKTMHESGLWLSPIQRLWVVCATQIFFQGEIYIFVLSCAWTMAKGNGYCLPCIWGWLFNEKPDKLLRKFLKYGYGQYSGANKTVFSICFFFK